MIDSEKHTFSGREGFGGPLTGSQPGGASHKAVHSSTPQLGQHQYAAAHQAALLPPSSSGSNLGSGSKGSSGAKFTFYESNSKLISLKKLSDERFQFPGNASESIYSPKSKAANRDFSLLKWFEKLLNHEKAIVLTVIDSELVDLVRHMHACYAEFGHGFFLQQENSG